MENQAALEARLLADDIRELDRILAWSKEMAVPASALSEMTDKRAVLEAARRGFLKQAAA